MGSVQRRGDTWQARYRTPEGASRSKAFRRQADALQFLATTEHKKGSGEYVDPSAGRITFEAFGEQWRAAQVHRPTTAAQVETNLRRHAYPHLGAQALATVRPSAIQAWVKAIAVDLAPGTVEVVYRYVAAIFRAAVADRIIPASPCVGVKLPKAEPVKVEPITVEQVEALRAGLPARYGALVTLGAGTGLRQGEAFGLTVDRVDFLRRTLTVDRQVILLPGGAPSFGPPKTQASYRTVPVADVVLEALSSHLAEHGTGADGLIFSTPEGGPIRRTRWSEWWRPVAAEAGLEPGVGFHALRHFYASSLIRQACSVKVVQTHLGHATAAETLDTYSHLWPDDDDRSRAAVDAVLGTSRVHPVSMEGSG